MQQHGLHSCFIYSGTCICYKSYMLESACCEVYGNSERIEEDQNKKMNQCKTCHKQSRTEIVWFREVTFGLNFIVNVV